MISIVDRFWRRVDCDGPILDPKLGRCWLWTGGRGVKGHGRFWDGKTEVAAAHFSYELEYGLMPPDKPFACHKCDNPPCVRPSHLFAGSPDDNMKDMIQKGRSLFGDKNPRAILTQDTAAEIRKMYATGEFFYRELAKTFGVSITTICFVIKKYAWVDAGALETKNPTKEQL
jgi:hypothetical protein